MNDSRIDLQSLSGTKGFCSSSLLELDGETLNLLLFMKGLLARKAYLKCFTLLFCATFFLGCPRNINKQRSDWTEKQVTDLMSQVKQKSNKVTTLEGRAKLRLYNKKNKRTTFRVVFQLKRPNFLHMQVIAALQQPALIVTSDGKEFAVHNLLQKQFIKGPAHRLPEFIQSFLPLPLSLEQLVPVLLGEVPILKSGTPIFRQPAKGSDIAKLELKTKEHQQKLWIDVVEKRVTKSELEPDGKTPFSLEYSNFESGFSLPTRIQFVLPKRSMRIHWIYLSKGKNLKLPIKHFRQVPPAGVPVTILR